MNISFMSFANLDKAEMMEYFKDNSRLENIISIYDKTKQAAIKRCEKYHDEYTEGQFWEQLEAPSAFHKLDANEDAEVTDFELEEYLKEYKNIYGDDITIDDFKDFLQYANDVGKKQYTMELKQVAEEKGIPLSTAAKIGLSRIELCEQFEENGNTYYKYGNKYATTIYDSKGNWIKDIRLEPDGYGNEVTRIYEKDTDGKQMYTDVDEVRNKTTIHKGNEKITIQNGQGKKETMIDTPEEGIQKARLDEVHINMNQPDTTTVKFEYDGNNKVSGIKIEQDTTNNMSQKAKGFTFDGKNYFVPEPEPKQVASDKTLDDMKSMIDGGGELGKDFDLDMEDGELKIKPKVINNTGEETPEMKGASFERYKELISSGKHFKEDFEVEYKDGKFEFRFLNSQARDFYYDYLDETYDVEGNLVEFTEIKDGIVTKQRQTNNGVEKITIPEEDFYMDLIKNNEYEQFKKYIGEETYIQGGYNIHRLADIYEQRTGSNLAADIYEDTKKDPYAEAIFKLMTNRGKVKSLMDYPDSDHGRNMTRDDIIDMYKVNREGIKVDFNPYESKSAHLLPQITHTQINPQKFRETINGQNFEVTMHDKFIEIETNGTKAKLDITQVSPSFAKNRLMKVNAQVLYDIAIGNVTIVENEYKNRHYFNLTGVYEEKSNQIHIDPNIVTGKRALMTIAHETGHSVDCIEDRENAKRALLKIMKNPDINRGSDKPLTIDELIEKNGINLSSSATNEELAKAFDKGLERLNKSKEKLDRELYYGATCLEEFAAEAYALLTTGHCKSEFVLSTYFTEALEIAKENIEINRQKDLEKYIQNNQ